MKIVIVTPVPRGSRAGNRVTAQRWARLLREQGHRVSVYTDWDRQPCDLLIALHARKSSRTIRRFRALNPDGPIVVALTGTDLYRDIERSRAARRSLDIATRLVVLQSRALDQLPRRLHAKVRVIHQSVAAKPLEPKRAGVFEVCVLGHLRTVKDPFRAAMAARRLPATSRVRILQIGGALKPHFAARARNEARINPRYTWLDERPRSQALRRLARSRLLVLSSKSEGGANVISEAIAAGVPVLASRIPGSTGLLGDDYPGLFATGDTRELTALLSRAENDRAFLRDLQQRCRRLRPMFHPARERRSWAKLITEVTAGV